MVTALGLYCDLLEEPGVLAAPSRITGTSCGWWPRPAAAWSRSWSRIDAARLDPRRCARRRRLDRNRSDPTRRAKSLLASPRVRLTSWILAGPIRKSLRESTGQLPAPLRRRRPCSNRSERDSPGAKPALGSAARRAHLQSCRRTAGQPQSALRAGRSLHRPHRRGRRRRAARAAHRRRPDAAAGQSGEERGRGHARRRTDSTSASASSRQREAAPPMPGSHHRGQRAGHPRGARNGSSPPAIPPRRPERRAATAAGRSATADWAWPSRAPSSKAPADASRRSTGRRAGPASRSNCRCAKRRRVSASGT